MTLRAVRVPSTHGIDWLWYAGDAAGKRDVQDRILAKILDDLIFSSRPEVRCWLVPSNLDWLACGSRRARARASRCCVPNCFCQQFMQLNRQSFILGQHSG